MNDFMNKVANYVEEKILPVLNKVFGNPPMMVLRAAVVGIMPFVVIGSVVLAIALLGTTSYGTAEPILPFLAPVAEKLQYINNVTVSIIGYLVSIAVAVSFAKQYKTDVTVAACIGAIIPLLVGLTTLSEGIPSKILGSKAFFVDALSSLLAMYLYKFLVDKKITIKMPKGVPAAVSGAFTSMIPAFVVIVVFWSIKSVFGIDLITLSNSFLAPILNAADNLFVYTLFNAILRLTSFFGMHASVVNSVVDPLKVTWIEANQAAKIAGEALPHIWSEAVDRTIWTASRIFPLIIMLMRSKAKHLRTIGAGGLVPAIFSITEPINFGVIAYNPLMFIPSILSETVGAFFTYLIIQMGLVERCFVQLPSLTPFPLIGMISSGDWKYILLVILNIVIGYIIYLPFFKVYEKQELESIQEAEEGK